jgi:hypothetical protein
MKMTAIIKLIEWWKNEFPDWEKSSEGYAIIDKAIELMEAEKQQIINAYEEANNKICASCWDCKIGEEYFKETYEK